MTTLRPLHKPEDAGEFRLLIGRTEAHAHSIGRYLKSGVSFTRACDGRGEIRLDSRMDLRTRSTLRSTSSATCYRSEEFRGFSEYRARFGFCNRAVLCLSTQC